MLTSEFNTEMGAFIRSVESQVRQDPSLIHSDPKDALAELDRLIARLVAIRLALKQQASDPPK